MTDFTALPLPQHPPCAPYTDTATPGADGCDVDITGLHLRAATFRDGALGLTLTGESSGQFADRDGVRTLDDAQTEVTIWEQFWVPTGEHPAHTDAMLAQYRATLTSWIEHRTPLRLTQQVGKTSVLTDVHGVALPVPRSRTTPGVDPT